MASTLTITLGICLSILYYFLRLYSKKHPGTPEPWVGLSRGGSAAEEMSKGNRMYYFLGAYVIFGIILKIAGYQSFPNSSFRKSFFMVYLVRLELTTTSFGGRYTNPLSYRYKKSGGYRGRTCQSLRSLVFETNALPSCPSSMCETGAIRTHDLLLRREAL